MLDYNQVLDNLQDKWEWEDAVPFKVYYEKVKAELDKGGFKPTSEQLDAILDVDKITLIDSTAGSGKTTSIVWKSIIDEVVWGIQPFEIVFLTFSRKSAADMSYKRDVLMGKHYRKKNYARMSTLHSFCFKFVDAFGKNPGSLKDFGIHRLISEDMSTMETEKFDTQVNYFDMSNRSGGDEVLDDGDFYCDEEGNYIGEEVVEYGGGASAGVTVIDIMKRFIKEDKSLEYINDLSQMKNIMSCFAYQKERMLSDDEMVHETIFQSLICSPEDYFRLRNKVEDHKKMFEYFDFTDLEVYTLKLLKEQKEFFYSNESFKRVFKPTKLYVDEGQDMTPLQKELIKELVYIQTDDNRTTSLVFIGDGDQRIYSWRGADTLEFSRFCDIYDPNREVAKLKVFTKNHRCGANILAVANRLINNNVLRNPKTMVPREGDPGSFSVLPYINSKDMIKNVTNKLDTYLQQDGKDCLEDVAIIYREHYQALGSITALLRKDIPFNLSGMKLPYKHWIFKNLLEFCKCIMFDYKHDHTKEIYKFTSLSKKDITLLLKQIDAKETETRKSVGWIEHLQENYKTRTKPFINEKSIIELMTLNKALFADTTSIQFILQRIYSLYMLHNLDYVLKNLIFVERSEIESIEFFISSIPKSENYDKLLKNIDDWERYIQNYRASRSGVKLMTMHSTKGLEFKRVIIIGMENSFCPKVQYMNELNEQNKLEYVEEERRLFFVAITRAIEECVVMTSVTDPSMFVLEIDDELNEIIKNSSDTPNNDRLIQEKSTKVLNIEEASKDIQLKITNQTDILFKEEFECFIKR